MILHEFHTVHVRTKLSQNGTIHSTHWTESTRGMFAEYLINNIYQQMCQKCKLIVYITKCFETHIVY